MQKGINSKGRRASLRLALIAISIFLVLLPGYLYGISPRHLRILTVNVWSGLDYVGVLRMGEYESKERREQRFQALVRQVRILEPDVIFIQEANPVKYFTQRLADSLGFDYVHTVVNAGIKLGPVGIPSNLKEGIAILARPSLELEEIDVWKLSGPFGIHGDILAFHFGEVIVSLAARIIIDGTPIYLVNVHLYAAPPEDSVLAQKFSQLENEQGVTEVTHAKTMKSWMEGVERRRTEVKQLLKHLSQLPDDIPVIVAGDFNTEPQSKEIVEFQAAGGFFDTFRPHTSHRQFTWDWEANENVSYSVHRVDNKGKLLEGYNLLSALNNEAQRRIDYVFLSRHFREADVLEGRVVLDSTINGIHASDHFGVLSVINVASLTENGPKLTHRIERVAQSSFEALPILSYDTDVGFGYGAKAFFLNMFGGSESFDIVAFNSTKGERWYRLVFSIPDFELRQGKIYPWALDLVIDYDKWIKNSFFGIGSNSQYQEREYYTKEPLEVTLTIGRGFTTHWVGQLGARYKWVRNYGFESQSRLVNIPPELNRETARYTSILASVRYDTRNSFIHPWRGLVLLAELEHAPRLALGNVSFTRFAGSIQYYKTVFFPRTVLAARLRMEGLMGKDLPVQLLLPVGGGNTLRGYPQDRYLDKTAAVANVELRFPIYWRFGGVVGYDAGKVWNSLPKFDFHRWATNPMVGLRFYMDTFVVRADIGFGKETTGFYLNFGHMF